MTTHLLSLLCCVLPLPAIAEDTRPRMVIVFGDSITEGGALPKQERTNAWVRVVERDADGRLQLVNEGKGGRSTAAVKEFDAMLERHARADVLVLAVGTNDSRDIARGCVPKAVANLRSMVTKARRAYGSQLRVLLIGPPNLCKRALGPTRGIADEREAKLRELGDAFAQLATELDCGFVSLFGVVPETSLAKDGVHPDSAGNAAIACAVLPKLQRLSEPND